MMRNILTMIMAAMLSFNILSCQNLGDEIAKTENADDSAANGEVTKPEGYKVGGQISGLSLKGAFPIVLELNGTEEMEVTENGAFSFPVPLAEKDAYTVIIKKQPAGRQCSLENSDGTIAKDHVTNIDVSCMEQIIIAGFNHNGTNRDWWIKKFNADGSEVRDGWDKTIDSGFGDDYVSSVAMDSQNNVYVAGYVATEDTIEWQIRKFSAEGVEDTANWGKVISIADGNEVAPIIAIDSSDNVTVAVAVAAVYHYIAIRRYSAEGVEDESWRKSYASGVGNDGINAMIIDQDDVVYMAGTYGSYYVSDAWIKKFDPLGVEDTANWNKIFDMGLEYIYASTIAIDSEGNIYTGGQAMAVEAEQDRQWWLKKFDENGNEDRTNWNKTFGKPVISDSVRDIKIDSQDNVYVSGTTNCTSPSCDWWLKKFSSDGVEDTQNWDKVIDGGFGKDGEPYLAIDSHDNIYAAGYAAAEGFGADWWVKKFSAEGIEDTENWNKIIDGGPEYAHPKAIAVFR